MISVGDRIPDVTVATMGADGPELVQTGELFAGKKVALFGVPGAFTPTCSIAHLPGYRDRYEDLKHLGIDLTCCISVNDAFVMAAWAKQQDVADEVKMLADGSGSFTTAAGLSFDGSAYQMGIRSQRYAMLVEDRMVTILAVEKEGAFEVSSAEALIAAIRASAPAEA